MLLRKTRAEAVDKVIRLLIQRYPSPEKLSRARVAHLIQILNPLGLHRVRSRALKDVASRLKGVSARKFLSEYDNIVSLPHVGRYTANAVLCMCYGKQIPMVDGNIVRLMHRVFGIRKPIEIHKADYMWEFVAKLIPKGRAREFNLGMLDLAAMVCTPGVPKCKICPLAHSCAYHKH